MSAAKQAMGVGVVVTAKAGPHNELLPAGATVIVIGLGPNQMNDLLDDKTAWVETPEGLPDVLLLYGRDARAIAEAIERKLGLKVPLP
jgi:hypothetical protein